jgi:hypothetical protein
MQVLPVLQLPPPPPPVPQQICPGAPQAAHWLPVAEMVQPSPAWQRDEPAPPSVPPPPPLVAQHGWLGPPQVEQVPAASPTRPLQPRPVWQVPLPRPQQGWPSPPQAPHLSSAGPRMQPRPAIHEAALPAQQG